MPDNPVLHLRHKDPPIGCHALITPKSAKELVENGFTINVESSLVRCFADSEYKAVGATITQFPLQHLHVYAGHIYKEQTGSYEKLLRYAQGGGILLDIDWLKYAGGLDSVTYEYHSGLLGTALAIKTWAHQLLYKDVSTTPPMPVGSNLEMVVQEAQEYLRRGVEFAGRLPRIAVIDAYGRCGSSAVHACHQWGIPDSQIVRWTRADTARPGPYKDILESDILLNCIFCSGSIPPLVDFEALRLPRKLSVICDISCNSHSPYNPIPIYSTDCTFEKPVLSIPVQSGPPLSVIAIPYLPSAVLKEACENAATVALPLIKQLGSWDDSSVWKQLEELFYEKLQTISETKVASRAML
ncbi:Saccharopine dehydrogenase [Aspergillus pseudotamarii]|uniref:Saccharopine dehydrogenase [NAD(+), L-lysine-forming] n=1 Tax=Aspergillus pseudotamarii TaxID=132259 RepID=A0A5N6SYW0_ASPPS|nr:Saccharopine dehydrogenase [Aspergillus pseudotamarii]KAE8139878.1 Saccharopine dehydrogenase [Aspergillus pseudotamarii]